MIILASPEYMTSDIQRRLKNQNTPEGVDIIITYHKNWEIEIRATFKNIEAPCSYWIQKDRVYKKGPNGESRYEKSYPIRAGKHWEETLNLVNTFTFLPNTCEEVKESFLSLL